MNFTIEVPVRIEPSAKYRKLVKLQEDVARFWAAAFCYSSFEEAQKEIGEVLRVMNFKNTGDKRTLYFAPVLNSIGYITKRLEEMNSFDDEGYLREVRDQECPAHIKSKILTGLERLESMTELVAADAMEISPSVETAPVPPPARSSPVTDIVANNNETSTTAASVEAATPASNDSSMTSAPTSPTIEAANTAHRYPNRSKDSVPTDHALTASDLSPEARSMIVVVAPPSCRKRKSSVSQDKAPAAAKKRGRPSKSTACERDLAAGSAEKEVSPRLEVVSPHSDSPVVKRCRGGILGKDKSVVVASQEGDDVPVVKRGRGRVKSVEVKTSAAAVVSHVDDHIVKERRSRPKSITPTEDLEKETVSSRKGDSPTACTAQTSSSAVQTAKRGRSKITPTDKVSVHISEDMWNKGRVGSSLTSAESLKEKVPSGGKKGARILSRMRID